MYQLTDKVLNALNNNWLIDGIFSDLEKALDYVNHKILLSKLELYGITATIINFTNPVWPTDIREHYCNRAVLKETKLF
jgi:hypothetical protein